MYQTSCQEHLHFLFVLRALEPFATSRGLFSVFPRLDLPIIICYISWALLHIGAAIIMCCGLYFSGLGRTLGIDCIFYIALTPSDGVRP